MKFVFKEMIRTHDKYFNYFKYLIKNMYNCIVVLDESDINKVSAD